MTTGRSVLVIGAGGHAKVVVRTLQDLGWRAEAVLDDDVALWGSELCQVPIAGGVAKWEDYGHLPAVLAIGDNGARKALAERLQLEWLTLVHPTARVDRSVELAEGSVVLAGAVIQPDARVGRHVIVNTGATVDHDCRLGDFVHIAPGVHLAGEVVVDEGGFIGIGSRAIQQVRIGAWTTVGAGATVIDDLPSEVVAVGTPARVKCKKQGAPHSPPVDEELNHFATNGTWSPLPETEGEANSKEQAVDAPPRIYLSPPHMSPKERELLLDAFDSNWIAPLGPHVDAFEKEFARKVGAQQAVALSSGTAALHLSLILLGVEPGDEVLTSSLTFAATANAITYVGARPVLIDSDAATWNMDPDLLGDELEACAKRGMLPKAVVAVDLYGQCADYDRITKICQFYEVPLIEDAAEALGATYRGQAAGTFGALGVFSFNGNKIITTSGGGMLVTDNQEWAEQARFLASQARDPAPHYQHSKVGYNYRMSNLLAAVGRGQLEMLDTRVEQRRANFDDYQNALGKLPGVRFMPEIPRGRSTRWLSCLVVDPDQFGATREEIRLALEQENIESRPLWKPMHLQPAFAGCRMRGGAVSEHLFEQGLCLPSGSNLTASDRQRIADIVRSVGKRQVPSEERVPASTDPLNTV